MRERNEGMECSTCSSNNGIELTAAAQVASESSKLAIVMSCAAAHPATFGEIEAVISKRDGYVNRLDLHGSVVAIATCCVLLLAGCGRSAQTTASRTKSVAPTLGFGPVYRAANVTDRLVAKTLRLAKKTRAMSAANPRVLQRAEAGGASFVSAEIRGYLVDWVGPGMVYELAAMKDGGLYRLDPGMRPSAAFGRVPPARVRPESDTERKAREAAVAFATRAVNKSRPQLASAKPVVYNYLVRIHRANGSVFDVWVDPDVNSGRVFYRIRLTRWTG